jgi:hypothetical protein
MFSKAIGGTDRQTLKYHDLTCPYKIRGLVWIPQQEGIS